MLGPVLEPLGESWLDRRHPFAKLVWLFGFTTAASLTTSLLFEIILLLFILVFYALIVFGRAKTPPVLRLAAIGAFLIAVLNGLFAGSSIGLWQNAPTAMQRLDQIALLSLRFVTTMVSVFVFTLTTVPRDMARWMDRLGLHPGISETACLGLRFIPVFEIQARLVRRSFRLRYPQHEQGSRHFIKRISRQIFALLILALEQANTVAYSLRMRNFLTVRIRTNAMQRPFGINDWLLMILGLLAAILVVGQVGGIYPFAKR